jgi:DNA-directed RNA polymerase subunit F
MDQIDFLADMEWQSSMPAGMIKIQCKHAERFASITAEELIEVVEEFYKQNSMPLGVTARFSNGETIYSKI